MGDTSKHLTYFKVENFKRFESFEMNDLGQFNLIVGDNNVGKTSVLEALLICEPSWTYFNRLAVALNFRRIKSQYTYGDLTIYLNKAQERINTLDVITFQLLFKKSNPNIYVMEFDFESQNLKLKGGASPENQSLSHNLSTFFSIDFFSNTPFIPFFKGHDDDLTKFYSKLQEKPSRKASFLRALKTIIPNVENIEPYSGYNNSNQYLIVYQKGIDAAIPLAMFGDGFIKLFRILAEIVLNAGGRLMIDEIDTGIYFSRFKEFWRVVLNAAIDNDVQLFMTTHNQECIQYFKEVLEEDLNQYKDLAKIITLVEHNETKKVTAHTYNFDQFEHAINVGNEIRA